MDTRPDLQGLATFVRERRRALGLTQCQLGERIDWAQERVSLLERGGYGLPSLIILARLARALGNPLSDLVSALGYDEIASAGLDQGEQESAACATLLYALEQFLTIRPGGLKEVMSQASDVAARAMGAEMVEVFVHQSSCSGLVALGSSGTELAIRQRELGLARLPVDASGRIAEVFKTGEPYATGHAHRDTVVLRGLRRELGIRSLLAQPIQIDHRTIGVLVAASTQPDRFSAEERHFFQAVAHWVGLVAEATELLDREEDHASPPSDRSDHAR